MEEWKYECAKKCKKCENGDNSWFWACVLCVLCDEIEGVVDVDVDVEGDVDFISMCLLRSAHYLTAMRMENSGWWVVI